MAGSTRPTGTIVGATAVVAVMLLLFLASTEPQPSLEVSGNVRRHGGVCLTLERWALFGWRLEGQTYSIPDIQNAVWHEPVTDPPCADVPDQDYLVRLPREAPDGVYRICGIADDDPCIELRRVPFRPTPGP